MLSIFNKVDDLLKQSFQSVRKYSKLIIATYREKMSFSLILVKKGDLMMKSGRKIHLCIYSANIFEQSLYASKTVFCITYFMSLLIIAL